MCCVIITVVGRPTAWSACGELESGCWIFHIRLNSSLGNWIIHVVALGHFFVEFSVQHFAIWHIDIWQVFAVHKKIVNQVNLLHFHPHRSYALNQSISRPVQASGCKNRPTPFPGQMSLKVTKPGSVCYILACFHCVFIFMLFIRSTFCVALVCICMCSVSWLFWLSCQYLPNDWVERLLWAT